MKPISNLTEVQKTVKNNPAILLYFYNDNCPPCISLRPKIQRLIDKYFPKMKIVGIDSGKSPSISAHYGIFANPAIITFFGGSESKRYSKYVSVDELRQDIQRQYQLVFDE